MSDKEFLIKYEQLLDKDYCNCNEMNCIDNNSPRRILNIAKKLQQEKLDLINWLESKNNITLTQHKTIEPVIKVQEVIDKIKEVM